MAKEEARTGSDIVSIEPGAPDFTNILQSQDISVADKRRLVLEGVGLKGRKRKYKTAEERKEAAKKRRDERKVSRLEVLTKYGLEPKKKGPKLTKAQKKAKRSARGRERRSFLREMAKENPDLAKKYGIDVSRFKL